MRVRIAEVHQQPVAEILRDVTFILRDDLTACSLISAHSIAKVFGVQPVGQIGGSHEVAEQNAEVAPLCFRLGDRRMFSGGSLRGCRRACESNDSLIAARILSRCPTLATPISFST